MNSLGNELTLAFCISLILLGVMYYLLGAEISYEPQYVELNVSLGENTIYNGTIRNIGSQDVDVRFSAEGIPEEGVNHIAINFDPSSPQIERGTAKLIHIYIDTTGALPGDYKGLIYIWNNKTKKNNNAQDVLEKIPITIQVKEIGVKYQSERTIRSLRTKNVTIMHEKMRPIKGRDCDRQGLRLFTQYHQEAGG